MGMGMGGHLPPVVDYGNAPLIYCDGLGRITQHGHNALFSFVLEQNGAEGRERGINLNMMVPIDAIAPGIELCYRTFGSRLLVPASKFLVNRLVC